MTSDIFVSHSSKDKTIADAVVAVLESKGVRCWVAPRDIFPGADWSESIIDAIHNTKAMVLVFSANANTSPQIKREVERAVNSGKPIIPFRIENVVPSKSLEYFISMPHWLDAFTPPIENHIQYLSNVVIRMLSGLAPGELELAGSRVTESAAATDRAIDQDDKPAPKLDDTAIDQQSAPAFGETSDKAETPLPQTAETRAEEAQEIAGGSKSPSIAKEFVLVCACIALVGLGMLAYTSLVPRAMPDQIAEAQQVLRSLGHNDVAVTKDLDEATQKAIRGFEADHQMSVDGRVSESLLTRLHVEAKQQQEADDRAAKERAYNRQIDAIKAPALRAQQHAEQAQREARTAAARARAEAEKARQGAAGHYAGNWPGNNRYEGEVNGNRQISGYGVYVYATGYRYEGHFNSNGMNEGYGIYEIKNGSRYEGAWSEDEYEGYGMVSNPSDNWRVFVGEFHHAIIAGYAVVTLARGATYYGEVKTAQDGKPHFDGQGALVETNGSTLAGVWRDGTLIDPIEKP